MLGLTAILFLTIVTVGLCFPNSADPVMAIPPLVNGNLCAVVTILEANCSSYNQVFSNLLRLPHHCPRPSKLVLKLIGQEQGVQYDRYGAVWIGDVEVLRTTTPEPTQKGIVWDVEKDISIYRDYIYSTPNLTTYLSIPNNVGNTYTGVISVTLQLAIYLDIQSVFNLPPKVIPLTKAISTESFPWTAMQVDGTQNHSYSIHLDCTLTSRVVLDLYASQGGCEEFYYSNVPANWSSELGICGGGVYREIQVYVDSYLAGSVYPFPVVYSGGINPFFWRPMAGIMSFSIESIQVDLSPFLDLFLDGNSHTVSVTVLGNNQNDGGYWFLDAALLVYENFYDDLFSASEVTHTDLFVYDGHAQVDVTADFDPTLRSTNITFLTSGYHVYEVARIVSLNNGKDVVIGARGQLGMSNSNTFVGTTTGIVNQRTLCLTESYTGSSDGTYNSKTKVDDIPFYLNTYYNEDAVSFDLAGTIDYSLQRSIVWKSSKPSHIHLRNPLGRRSLSLLDKVHKRALSREFPPRAVNHSKGNITWILSCLKSEQLTDVVIIIDELQSVAAYNRTNDHSIVYEESGKANQKFSIQIPTSSNSYCFYRVLSSEAGYFTIDNTLVDECSYPIGTYSCAYDICGTLNWTNGSSNYFSLEGMRSSPSTQVLREFMERDLSRMSSRDIHAFVKGLRISHASAIPVMRHGNSFLPNSSPLLHRNPRSMLRNMR